MLLSEGSQPEKATDSKIPTLGQSGKGKTMETAKINGYEFRGESRYRQSTGDL